MYLYSFSQALSQCSGTFTYTLRVGKWVNGRKMYCNLLGENLWVINLQWDLRQVATSWPPVLSTVPKMKVCLLTSLSDFILKFSNYTVTKKTHLRGSAKEVLESEDKVESVHLMTWEHFCSPICQRSSKESEELNIISFVLITLFLQVIHSPTFSIWKH